MSGGFEQSGTVADRSVTAYTDSGLPVGATYLYKVRAVGLNGQSDYSNTVEARTLTAEESSPLVVSATTDKLGTKIVLSFDLPLSDVPEDIKEEFTLTEGGNPRLITGVTRNEVDHRQLFVSVPQDSLSDYDRYMELRIGFSGSGLSSEYGVAVEGFDGYRIVQISDIHIGSWQGNPDPIKQLVDSVNGQKPDLIVFTGDLVNQQSHELDGFQEILSQLYAPDGVYSILGNHDYGSYYHWQSPKAEIANLDYLIRQQKAMGWKLLNNEHDILHHKGDSIALIGVENDGEPPFSQFADLPQAMQGTEGMFQILLSHNPTHWRREVLPQSDISLMLAGHTHAMQGILFGHSLAELIYPEWRGMYYEGKRALYVNIGIGYVGLPFRFGACRKLQY